MDKQIIQHHECNNCKIVKPLTKFFKQSDKPNGHQSQCKKCTTEHKQKTLASDSALSSRLCECGCGGFTKTAARSYRKTRKGEAYKFIKGHSLKLLTRQYKNTSADFWKLVKQGDGCWEWQGSRRSDGYGSFMMKGKLSLTHRLAYAFAYDDLKDDDLVRHKCDNPPCVRPDHLELGTHSDNVMDAIIRARNGKHWLAALFPDDVREVRKLRMSGISPRAIAESFGIRRSVIYAILQGKTYKHVV